MRHSLILLPVVFLFAGISGTGQIIIPGGGGYPGGGYPGGGYPGGGYPGGGYPGGRRNPNNYPQQNPQANQNNTNTLTGMLRKIDDKDVVLQEDDKSITTISISKSTKYSGIKGQSVKIGDFQPGDHVSISGKNDDKNVLHAQSVMMIQEGTPEEHSAASFSVNDTSHPILADNASSDKTSDAPVSTASARSSGSSSSGSSGGPTLRRAAGSGSDSDSSVNSSRAASAPVQTAAPDDDPDRPRLRRNDSSASASNSGSASGTGSGSSQQNAPIVQNTPTSSATVAPPRPSGSSGSYGQPAQRDSDDSGPPQLRRATPADSGGSSGSTSGNSDTVVASSARPSLHADDDNGVTRMPSAPRVGSPAEEGSSPGMRMPSRMAQSGDSVVDSAREAAFSFTETLPNYVVKQFTTRYATGAARGGHTSWQALDNVTADVIEENGVEKYKNILVNGKTPAVDPEKSGSWSRGEFSSLQLDVLSPGTNADFHGKRDTTIVNRPAFRYDFSVDQPNSHWHVESEGQSYLPAYTGSIWIDKQNYRVLRIELSARDMPRSFPLDTVESAVDYDYVLIGEGKYLLPVHSEALSCERGTSECSRNVIEFRNYKKFTADTSITFDPNN